jgi:hypothetical protein
MRQNFQIVNLLKIWKLCKNGFGTARLNSISFTKGAMKQKPLVEDLEIYCSGHRGHGARAAFDA